MANGIRIDELDATVLPSRDHEFPAMKDGLTVKLTVGQILNLLEKVLDPDEVGSKALFAALNLSDLDDPAQARENLGATEIGHALFTAVSKAAGRAAIDALGPSETADKAFRRGNIIGTVSQDGGVPTGELFEYDSNANGEYVRFANGLQICWKTVSVTTAVDLASGSVYLTSSTILLGDWPAAFISPPARIGLQRGGWGLYSGQAPTETSAGRIGFWRPTSTSSQVTEHDFVGIGRWF